jgi:hypothetical protein
MDKLERISLRDNLLEGRIPANLGSCRSLIEFFIQSNRIEGEIPQSIGDLEELRFFEANNIPSARQPAARLHPDTAPEKTGEASVHLNDGQRLLRRRHLHLHPRGGWPPALD